MSQRLLNLGCLLPGLEQCSSCSSEIGFLPERLLNLWCVLSAVVEHEFEGNTKRHYGADFGAQGGFLSERLFDVGCFLSAVERGALRGAENGLLSERLLDVWCLLSGELEQCSPCHG